jgi:hypothetical protein
MTESQNPKIARWALYLRSATGDRASLRTQEEVCRAAAAEHSGAWQVGAALTGPVLNPRFSRPLGAPIRMSPPGQEGVAPVSPHPADRANIADFAPTVQSVSEDRGELAGTKKYSCPYF